MKELLVGGAVLHIILHALLHIFIGGCCMSALLRFDKGAKFFTKLNKFWFYILSFTWGLPMSLVGVVVFLVLRLCGYKAQKYGHCYHIAVGKNWGGLELGWLFLTDEKCSDFTMKHELGHGYQNCLFGPFMVILSLISACRYWLNRWGMKLDYYKWWFEAQANEIGKKVMEK
jgi:hypothetical protein